MSQLTWGAWSLRELGRRLIANASGFLFLAALATARQAAGACPDFRLATAPKYEIAAPYGIAVGDFNGDGRGDLAVASGGPYNLSILLNNGNGTFATTVKLVVGAGTNSVAAGDFNGDGALDLAVTKGFVSPGIDCDFNPWSPTCDTSNSNNVSVLLGHGDGSFDSPVSFDAGSSPASVAVGDFNGDGASDLAIANLGSFSYGVSDIGSISILLGDGHGAFATAVDFSTGAHPAFVAVGEFNGDGIRDLAVANSGSDSVSILLGNGNGTFAGAMSFGTGVMPTSLSVADFNGDGKRDLAVANFGSNSVSILLGNGDGTFATSTNCYTPPTGPSMGAMQTHFVAVADLNADNKIDLVIANYSYVDVSIALGNGDGTFAPAVNYGVGKDSWCIVPGFLNDDAYVDLAVGVLGDDDVAILFGKGDGTFDNYGAGSYPEAVVTGDFNGDGSRDLAVANDQSDNVSILLGDGTGRFSPAVDTAVGHESHFIAANDFNRDGMSDLAVVNSNSANVSILLGDGTGMFAPPVNYGTGGTAPHSLAIDDFNSDGRDDLAVANYGSVSNVSILPGLGDGTFGAAVLVANFFDTSPYLIAACDFDGDGRRDLVVGTAESWSLGLTLCTLRGNGNGTFAPPVRHDVDWPPTSLAIGDFNRDGRDDVAVAYYSSGIVSILLSNGDGSFANAGDYLLSEFLRSIASEDFSGDGTPDLAVANSESNTVTVLVGEGNGSFARAINYRVGGGPFFVAVGDMNGDGKHDLVTANRQHHDVSVLLNVCGLPAIGDANGDGELTVTDVFHLINSLFAGGTPATSISDSNGDGRVDAADLFYLVNFLFAGGPR